MRTIKFSDDDELLAMGVEPVKSGDVFVLDHPECTCTVMVCPENEEVGCAECVLYKQATCNVPRTTEGLLLCYRYVFKSIDSVMEEL